MTQSTEQSKVVESTVAIEAGERAAKARTPDVPGTRRSQVMWFLIGSTIVIALFLAIASRVMRGHRTPEPVDLNVEPTAVATADTARAARTRQSGENARAASGSSPSALPSEQKEGVLHSSPAASARNAPASVAENGQPALALTESETEPTSPRPGAPREGSNADPGQSASVTRATPPTSTQCASAEHPPAKPQVSSEAKAEGRKSAGAQDKRAVRHTVHVHRTRRREVRSAAANKLESIGISEE